ncbi:PREDICTED: uncharacterized protein LOC106114509 [Papilio xuthus]|uniref:Uncharacterized protein LOC106114509 n=1 Tax=Papilio xuthus TaxID=66420 RepID=A0AAJ7E582_PAPXU|nr:PREDICTED: uncharacterized protein LOC106114509 [Papilio xuthus]
MSLPTVTIDELSKGIDDPTTNDSAKKLLEGILNDFMDLQYGKETPYTTGKQVIPSGCTVQDLDSAITDETTDKKFKAVFVKISEVNKSGDLTPQTNNGGWDPKFTPVLVLVTPNP